MSRGVTKERYYVWLVHNPSVLAAGKSARKIQERFDPRSGEKTWVLRIYGATFKKFILYAPKKRRVYVVLPYFDNRDQLTLETQDIDTLDGPKDVPAYADEWIINN